MPNLLINISGCHAVELAEFIEHQIDECKEALKEPGNSECHIKFLEKEIKSWESERVALVDHFYGRSGLDEVLYG